MKPLPQQSSEAEHDHFLHAAKPHPGVASRQRCKASSFGNCHSILLPHPQLTVFSHQSPGWSSILSSCPIMSLHVSFPLHAVSLTLIPADSLLHLDFAQYLLASVSETNQKQKHKQLRKGSKPSPHYLPKRGSWESKYTKWYGCSGLVNPWIKW